MRIPDSHSAVSVPHWAAILPAGRWDWRYHSFRARRRSGHLFADTLRSASLVSKLRATPPRCWRALLRLSESSATAILILSISTVAVPLIWSTSKEQGALVSQPRDVWIPLIFAVLSMGTRLGKMVKGMAYALGDIPVTVKMRTGVKDNLPTAHKLFPKAHAWGAGAVAVGNESLWIVLVLILVLAPRSKSAAALLSRSRLDIYQTVC